LPKLLTVAAVQRLRPGAERREVRDGGAPGLRLVIQPSGHKSWAMRLRRPDGRHCKVTLGPVDLSTSADDHDPVLGAPLTLSSARILAAQLSRQRAQGIDVATLKPKASVLQEHLTDTFAKLAQDFIVDHAMAKNRSWRDAAKVLGLDYPRGGGDPITIRGGLAERWAATPPSQVDAGMIYSVVDEARRLAVPGRTPRTTGTSDARGRQVAGVLGKLFSWAAQHRRVATNPTTGTYRPKAAAPRHRVLSAAEIRQLWKVLDQVSWPFAAAIRLMLITGQRRNEIAGMRWDELSENFSTWSLPPARTKNKLPHTIYLPPMARSIVAAAPRIVGSDYVFTTGGGNPVRGFSKVKAKLDSLVPIPAWTLHDLRRTAATSMAELGIAPHIIEAVLNHVSGAKAGVAGVYNRAAYAPEKKAALERWADHLASVVSGKPAKVVPIRGGSR
jgi:integrase